jgi:2-keto-4-pentenoate hydratase/2-oxohepta-3-ene-1,7-dioic acid hydratase in catechol pathway
MRVCSYLMADGTASYGVVDGETLVDAGKGLRVRHRDLRAVLAAGALAELASADGERLGLSDVTLLPPVANPDKILCIGLNYMTHIRETGREAPKKPSIFTRYPSSLVGHAVDLVRPKASDWFDFEGELAVVIGKAGRAIPAARAYEHVAGYSCFNDGSIRDFQRHTTQFWAGKNFDRSGSMGPWLVTGEAFGDPTAGEMTTRLNGEVMQATPLSDLAFDVPALIEYISTVTELLPGDIIATGTPSGVGLFREPRLFMKPGDRVEVEITGIGILANRIVDEA